MLHKLPFLGPLPPKFNNPFCYTPDPLCLKAADEVRAHIDADEALRREAAQGKMFGVLVVETIGGETGYLAAFSGQLLGRSTLPFFVPPVYDASQPGGYFKVHEAEITAINHTVEALEHSGEYLKAKKNLELCILRCLQEEDDFRRKMNEAKVRRDEIRNSSAALSPEEDARLIRESQFMKAEMRRIRQKNRLLTDNCKQALEPLTVKIKGLKARRKQLSDNLQRWLFSRYIMLNARGEERDLCDIFAATPQRTPPSGAGDCCAPKLLQYAYQNSLRPVCMAEFWYGASPKTEVRRDGMFYPACRGKCLPILTFMLQGLDVERECHEHAVSQPLEVVYEDPWIIVVNKPAGMKSVPGRESRLSVQSLLEERLSKEDSALTGNMTKQNKDFTVKLVHRLDMDTSGLLIAAKDAATYKALQRQFARREVKKRYVALLETMPQRPRSGTISLPLIADPLDRPYQKVDRERGKPAVTDYVITGETNGHARIILTPHTGRTHQLRLHCAHADGLGTPILGDRLYGHRSTRMFLHAEAITFTHPVTGKEMRFERKEF